MWKQLLSPGRTPLGNNTVQRCVPGASGSSSSFGLLAFTNLAALSELAGAEDDETPLELRRVTGGCPAEGRPAGLWSSASCFCLLTPLGLAPLASGCWRVASRFGPLGSRASLDRWASSRSAAKVPSPLSTKCAIISSTSGCDESLRSNAMLHVSFAAGSFSSCSMSIYSRTKSHFLPSSSSRAKRSGSSSPRLSASGTRTGPAPFCAAKGTRGMKCASWKQRMRGCRQQLQACLSNGR
mmetsp:Transcript_47700/g.142508  ORF Transcript_47700/g.142508 Transcript_47700/m.142508 type:complete len:239 (+) Transcript_47700:298-1014(+)